jgi:2'-5' RNA ligase
MDELLAYWLIPAQPHRAELEREIAGLAQKLNAPTFTPHVTIYAGPAGAESATDVIASAVAGLEPFTLDPVGIEHSAKFTKTLYVEFAPSEVLAKLSTRLRALSSTPAEYHLQPHLSLAYQHMPEEQRADLARTAFVPGSPVRFDEVYAVLCPSSNDSAEDVRSWRTVTRHRLG